MGNDPCIEILLGRLFFTPEEGSKGLGRKKRWFPSSESPLFEGSIFRLKPLFFREKYPVEIHQRHVYVCDFFRCIFLIFG